MSRYEESPGFSRGEEVKRIPNPVKVGRWRVSASRWPWQDNPLAYPLNSNGARFGAGWRWCLGVKIGSSSVLFDLGWGTIRIWKGRKR